MATIAKLSSSPSFSSSSIFFQYDSIPSSCIYYCPLISKARISSLKSQANDYSSGSVMERNNILDFKEMEKILKIHCIEEYDKGLQFSQEKLVIAHFSASHYKHNPKIQEFMEGQCSNEVMFLSVMANESAKTMQLCRREKIDRIPHFIFYKKAEKIHEEAGFEPKKLLDDILYYNDDPFSLVVQLQSREDLEKLMKIHMLDHKLIVLVVGKMQCIPCVKIYPSVVKMASQMAGKIVFARMNADENDGCMEMLREMKVNKVPAFLFLRNGELCGRYVGSCMSYLVREIVKLQNDHYMASVYQKKINLINNAVIRL